MRDTNNFQQQEIDTLIDKMSAQLTDITQADAKDATIIDFVDSGVKTLFVQKADVRFLNFLTTW